MRRFVPIVLAVAHDTTSAWTHMRVFVLRDWVGAVTAEILH